jgi:hypothetical protein
MAKALNMLHTASGTLAKDGIFMNAVDTGWVPMKIPARKETGFGRFSTTFRYC